MNKLILVIFALSANIVCAQSWLPLECGLNQVGYVIYPDFVTGKLFVGGSMQQIFPSCDHGDLVTVWDGTSWDSSYALHGGGGDIRAITRYQNHLYAGGNTGFAYGHRIQGFTRWNGSFWDSLGVSLFPINSAVPYKFCEYNNNGKIYSVTAGGGLNSLGTLFCFDTLTNICSILHSFSLSDIPSKIFFPFDPSRIFMISPGFIS